jgi:hypothetical protein
MTGYDLVSGCVAGEIGILMAVCLSVCLHEKII